MTDEQTAERIHAVLNDHGKKLSDIQKTLERIAVQDEQIRSMQEDIRSLWSKYDLLQGPDGTMARVTNWQASCPRAQIKFLWMVVIPMGLTNLGLALKIFSSFGG